MARKFDLERDSRDFANRMTDLLNKTICDGIRLTAVVEPGKRFTVIGYNLTSSPP